MKTLKNLSTALNTVNSVLNNKNLYDDLVSLFPEGDLSMYNSDGSLNKRTRDKIKTIIADHVPDCLGAYVDDRYNSIKIELKACCHRNKSVGVEYYTRSLYVVSPRYCTAGTTLYNQPIPFSGNNVTNWTESKIQKAKEKIEKLDRKIRDLESEKNMIKWSINL